MLLATNKVLSERLDVMQLAVFTAPITCAALLPLAAVREASPRPVPQAAGHACGATCAALEADCSVRPEGLLGLLSLTCCALIAGVLSAVMAPKPLPPLSACPSLLTAVGWVSGLLGRGSRRGAGHCSSNHPGGERHCRAVQCGGWAGGMSTSIRVMRQSASRPQVSLPLVSLSRNTRLCAPEA